MCTYANMFVVYISMDLFGQRVLNLNVMRVTEFIALIQIELVLIVVISAKLLAS